MLNYQNLRKSLEEAFDITIYASRYIVEEEAVLGFTIRKNNGAAFAVFYPELFERTYSQMARTKIMVCVTSMMQVLRGERTASAKRTLYEFISAGLAVLY